MVSTNQLTLASASLFIFSALSASHLKRSPTLHVLNPRQLATTALLIGTACAVSACGVATGVVVRALGCRDFEELGVKVKRWKGRELVDS
jgi:hypothetical protein